MDKKNFEFIVLQLLLAIIIGLYIIGRSKGLNVLIFWPLIWLLIFVTFLIVYKLPKSYKIISLVILSITISMVRILALPEMYQFGRDGVFEAQFASTIVSNGNWDPSLGSGFAENYYGYHPALHFIIAMTSLTTGLDSYILAKYAFFAIFRLIIVLLVYLNISVIIKEKSGNMQYLATLLFVGTSGMSFIGISRRSMASIFLLLAFFTILKEQNSSNKLLWNGLYIMFSFLLIISDRSISLYFLVFLLGAFIFLKILKLIYKKQVIIFPSIGYKLLYFFILFFAWRTFVTTVANEQDVVYIKGLYEILSSQLGIMSLLDLGGSINNINIYHLYELFIIYSSQFLFLVLGLIGLFFFMKYLLTQKILISKFTKNEYFLLYLALYGFVLYIISFLFMKTQFDVAIIIFLWFFCIPISIFAIYFLEVVVKKIIWRKLYMICLALIILFLYTGSLMMGVYTPRVTNREADEDVVVEIDDRAKTEELLYSAKWLDENSDGRSNLMGGLDVYEIYSGFFEFNVNFYPHWLRKLYSGNASRIIELTAKNIEFGVYKHTFHFDKLDYFIIDKAFSKYRSKAFPSRIDFSNTEILNQIPLLDKTYSNDEVYIYKIERDFFGGNKIEQLET